MTLPKKVAPKFIKTSLSSGFSLITVKKLNSGDWAKQLNIFSSTNANKTKPSVSLRKTGIGENTNCLIFNIMKYKVPSADHRDRGPREA